MSIYEQRLAATAEKRVSVLLHDAANLNLQFSELNRLRDRVRQAEGLAWKSKRNAHLRGHFSKPDELSSVHE
jgi:hypothetical protein